MNHPVYEEHRNEQGILVSRHLNTLDCQICQSKWSKCHICGTAIKSSYADTCDTCAMDPEAAYLRADQEAAADHEQLSAEQVEREVTSPASATPASRPAGSGLKQELARVAQEVSEQYVTEARLMRDAGRPDVALVKAEVAEAFRYFGELVLMSEIGEHDEYDRYHAQDPGSAGPGALPH